MRYPLAAPARVVGRRDTASHHRLAEGVETHSGGRRGVWTAPAWSAERTAGHSVLVNPREARFRHRSRSAI